MHGAHGRICRRLLNTSLLLLLSPDRPHPGSPDAKRHLLSSATVARRGATMAASSSAAASLFPRPEGRSHNAANRWTTRIIPVFLLAVIGFACWALTRPICSESDPAAPDAIGPEGADPRRLAPSPVDFFIARNQAGSAVVLLVLHYIFLILMLVCYARTLYTVTYNPGVVPLDPKLGLESFYTRDFYTCRSDGLPIWCSDCQNWKPDRAHHSGDIQRCVKKMDHYCPWAGGMIGETGELFCILRMGRLRVVSPKVIV